MQILKCEQRSDEWEDLRLGRITGTALARLLGRKDTQESLFYEILAERLMVDDGMNESEMDRGNRLENEAREAFEKITGKKVEQVGLCVREDNKWIANSPDGLIKNGDKYTEAVEIKCLSSANHIRAILENAVPDKYMPQVIQYFIVNDDLEKLHFVLYDPRITSYPIHVIVITRDSISSLISDYRGLQEGFLAKVNESLIKLVK